MTQDRKPVETFHIGWIWKKQLDHNIPENNDIYKLNNRDIWTDGMATVLGKVKTKKKKKYTSFSNMEVNDPLNDNTYAIFVFFRLH